MPPASFLPLLSNDLHWLAEQRIVRQPTRALDEPKAQAYEASVRRIDGEDARHWNGRGHFFAAAAEALRRILVDDARLEVTTKREGETASHSRIRSSPAANDIVRLDEALTLLGRNDPAAAQLIQLRYFAGLSLEQAADTLGISPHTAENTWRHARAWLLDRIQVHGDSR